MSIGKLALNKKLASIILNSKATLTPILSAADILLNNKYSQLASELGFAAGDNIDGLFSLESVTDLANSPIMGEAMVEVRDRIEGQSLGTIPTLSTAIAIVPEISTQTNALLGGSPKSLIEMTNDIAAKTTNTFTDVDSVVGNISSVVSINPNASLTEGIKNFSGNSNLTAPFSGVLNSSAVTSATDVINSVASGEVGEALLDDEVFEFNERVSFDLNRGLEGTMQNVIELETNQSESLVRALITNGSSMKQSLVYNIITAAQSPFENQREEAVRALITEDVNTDAMQSVIEQVGRKGTVDDLAAGITEVATIRNVDQADIDDTILRLSNIQEGLDNMDTTVAGSIESTGESFSKSEYTIGQNLPLWNGSETENNLFTYIASEEELGSEVASYVREITEVVVHATETFSNVNIGAEEIHETHNNLGMDGIGYHYVIRRDGRLQRGRPVDREGTHTNVNNHDQYSIGIVLVGGINASAGVENPHEYRSAKSFTRTQMSTLEAFLAAFYRRYPAGQVVGHNDIDIAQEDPYFDVINYVESVFKKSTLFTDTTTDSPFSSVDLIEKEL
jgi:N-acetylmuramoyl-L-alanine amidase